MVRDASGDLRTVKSLRVRDASNVLRSVSAVRVRDADNVLRDLASVGGMTVTPSGEYIGGYGNSHAPIIISTVTVSVTVAGGTAPYSYLWTADFGSIEAINPTSAATPFRSTSSVGPGDSASDVFICTVTDAHGNTAASSPVNIDVTNFGT